MSIWFELIELIIWISKHNLIGKGEQGFPKRKDSLIHTAEFKKKLNKYLNQGKSVDQIILEFQNEFKKGKTLLK